MERGKHSNGQRRERERQVGVTVCDVLATAVTHCNGVGVYFTGSISHGTNIHLSTHRFWNTHALTHNQWAYRACVTDRAQPQASTPLVTNYFLDALIHSYTPLQMVILWSWSIVAAIPLMASISFLCRPFGGIDSVLEWSAMIPADDVEHYSSLFEMEEGGIWMYRVQCKIHSLISSGVSSCCFFFFSPSSIHQMHLNFSCVVCYSKRWSEIRLKGCFSGIWEACRWSGILCELSGARWTEFS